MTRYEQQENTFWHSMYERLRLDGCKVGSNFLKYHPDPSKSDVEFK